MTRDHHTALKAEKVETINAGSVELVLARLQWSKDEIAYTLHVNPTSYSSAGLQTTDWLSYLGFQRNARCQFIAFDRCYSKEVPEGFDLKLFATAFNGGFAHLQKADQGLQACGFQLRQPEGFGFFHGTRASPTRNLAAPMSGDGHTAMKRNVMKQAHDDKFTFSFTFIENANDKGFVTHYRPKHPPLSPELNGVFQYLGLKEFKDCPEFDFKPCYFRTLRLVANDGNPFAGNVDYAHRSFDAHASHFSPAIENLLAANAAAETVGMTFLPIEKAATRMRTEIATNVLKPSKAAARTPTSKSTAIPDNFDVAISYAGTERALAKTLASAVRNAGFSVFFDNYYPEHLWGKNLPIFFDEIYRKRARYCVILVSQEYRDRKWTILESRSAQARALEEKGKEYILPIRVDDVELEGLLPTVGYISISAGIEKISEMLVQKLTL